MARVERKQVWVCVTLLASIGGVAEFAWGQTTASHHGPPAPIAEAPKAPPATPTEQQELASIESSALADEGDQKTGSRAPSEHERLPLGDPASARRAGGAIPAPGSSSASSSSAWWVRTGGALAIVITLIMLLRVGLTKVSRLGGGLSHEFGAGGRAPSGVLQVLGRYPVSRGQSLVLLQMDRRIVLLGQTASGFTTLSEVTDPDEVASLLVKTRDEEGLSMAAQFNAMLDEVGRDQGLLDEPISIVDRDGAAREDTISAPQPVANGEQDPASMLQRRLVGLRGLEA